jgi:hypothetical protein
LPSKGPSQYSIPISYHTFHLFHNESDNEEDVSYGDDEEDFIHDAVTLMSMVAMYQKLNQPRKKLHLIFPVLNDHHPAKQERETPLSRVSN